MTLRSYVLKAVRPSNITSVRTSIRCYTSKSILALLANKVTNIQLEAENKNLRRILMLSIGISFMACVVIVLNMIESSSEIEHFKRVEWLYRWSRINRPDSEEFQDFERRMLQGTKVEREGLKTKIFHLERKAPQFQYFRPVDDWQPEPPKEEEAEKSDTDTHGEHTGEAKPQQSTTKPLPHELKTNLTPGEIAAIKAMRANPTSPKMPSHPFPTVTNNVTSARTKADTLSDASFRCVWYEKLFLFQDCRRCA